eukprot:scaffold5006_cov116-Isochrysis_galbana.AAC.11
MHAQPTTRTRGKEQGRVPVRPHSLQALARVLRLGALGRSKEDTQGHVVATAAGQEQRIPAQGGLGRRVIGPMVPQHPHRTGPPAAAVDG